MADTEYGSHMLAVERQRMILEALRDHGSVLVSDIAKRCGVSSVTLRSDLDVLEAQGKLKRTHGGAVPVSHFVVPTVAQRMRRNAKAKRAIAACAAAMVADGETILVGSGSTALELVRALADRRGVSVVTDDVNIMEFAEAHAPALTMVATGGTFGRQYRHLSGKLLAASLAAVSVDKVFVGADGFEPEQGFLVEYGPTAEAKREFLRHGRRRVVLMDSSKVGAGRSFECFAGPNDVDTVVMEKDPSGIVAEAIAVAAHGDGKAEVVIAPPVD